MENKMIIAGIMLMLAGLLHDYSASRRHIPFTSLGLATSILVDVVGVTLIIAGLVHKFL